jgi:hypothetical protein
VYSVAARWWLVVGGWSDRPGEPCGEPRKQRAPRRAFTRSRRVVVGG